MQFRHVLAAVTATAALAPAALLAAPAAYAAETPDRTPAASASGAPTGTPTNGTNPPTHSPTPGESSPLPPLPRPGQSSPPPQAEGGKGAVPAPAAEKTPPAGKTGTGTPTATPTPSDEPECSDYSSERAVRTELRGLPSKIVAGSGWVDFTFRATNTSRGHIKSVDAFALVSALKIPTTDDVSDHLTLQWFDARTGAWKRVPGAEENDGFFASLGGRDGLAPGEYAEARLRLKADATTPASYGGAVSVGWYVNANHECGYSKAMDYDFAILPAGSGKPGPRVPDAQGKPGQRPHRPAPQGGTKQQVQLPVTGKLAETGASSGLPTLALAGGAAVAVGAGAVFAVRRRKGADAG
ncbi:LPXTG cell wall anchor domain-containing protein [Streptomyces sp. NPDC018019]|uniref:LPXTG cell wall anchor domain-containing protein n=1 Tax=Streptomyces sp. NPDC018019 TaxID=3365030 RepID=UPI0037882A28